ncbi:hypothetical protein SCUCBS95973_002451 [Sporothrix curviconia]|uniref:EthD domain-containing protein n=1 Tax=Sporothrix curviconia TaxID=1260050 RepID=A0ABP0B710_9PEZI
MPLPLAGPAPSPTGKYVKITMFLKKLPHVSNEYFSAYWANNHVAPALKNKVFRDKVRRYNQQHITPDCRELASKFGAPVLDYDGVAEIWVDSLDDWMTAVTDPALVAAVDGDDKNFMVQPVHIMVSFDHLVLGGEEWKPNGGRDSKL